MPYISNMRLFVLALLFASALPAAHAQPASSCEPGQTYVSFINGVNTTSTMARSYAITLGRTLLARSNADEIEIFRWGYVYNQTGADFLPGGGFFDFVQAYEQWEDDLAVRFARWVAGTDPAPNWFQQAFLAYIAAIDAVDYVTDVDLNRMVGNYSELTEQGNRVLVVSHSQGNFYANQAHRLVDSSGISIVSVATPASLVEGGGGYVSLTGDDVVGVSIGSLPANVTNPSEGDAHNHGFVTSYLTGPNSRAAIVARFEDAARTTPFPNPQIGSGIITARLTWGAEPDVDLHAYEPNGTHVFYANPDGESGFLDVDDVSSFGPEHYYVSCETLETGTYRFGVNYYSGSGPETATLQITAGPVTRSYSRTLTSPRGSSGDDIPFLLSDVIVARNPSGEYTFAVQSASGTAAPQPRATNGHLLSKGAVWDGHWSSRRNLSQPPSAGRVAQ